MHARRAYPLTATPRTVRKRRGRWQVHDATPTDGPPRCEMPPGLRDGDGPPPPLHRSIQYGSYWLLGGSGTQRGTEYVRDRCFPGFQQLYFGV
eukprot:scaffold225667_cov33-Tisochrysis_lutea.AAC.1